MTPHIAIFYIFSCFQAYIFAIFEFTQTNCNRQYNMYLQKYCREMGEMVSNKYIFIAPTYAPRSTLTWLSKHQNNSDPASLSCLPDEAPFELLWYHYYLFPGRPGRQSLQ